MGGEDKKEGSPVVQTVRTKKELYSMISPSH